MNGGDIYSWEETTDRGYSIGWNLKTLIQKGMPNNVPPQTLDAPCLADRFNSWLKAALTRSVSAATATRS